MSRPVCRTWLTLAMGLTGALLGSPTWSRDLVVDPENGPYVTIQSALDEAAESDTVSVAPGVYSESLYNPATRVLRSIGGAEATILDGLDRFRLLDSEAGELTLEGFTVRRGRAKAGAGVRVRSGRATIRDCVFESNRAEDADQPIYASGGALLLTHYGTSLVVERCLFRDNRAGGSFEGEGGAIALAATPLDGGAAGTPLGPEATSDTLRVRLSSFLGNEADEGPAIYTAWLDVLEVTHSLFAEPSENRRAYIHHWPPATFGCNLSWPEYVPLSSTGRYSEVRGDPLICPGDRPVVHARSPALEGPTCGAIGNLPVGCSGPLLLETLPPLVEPVVDAWIRFRAFGADESSTVELLDPQGRIVETKLEWVSRDLVIASADLSEGAFGPWSAVLISPGEADTLADAFVLPGATVFTLENGWVERPGLLEGWAAGKGFDEDLSLELVHRDSGTKVPVDITEILGPDTLRFETDLGPAPEGLYDLHVENTWGVSHEVPGVLFLGSPTVVRVPEDYPSPAEALARVGPGTEIQVAGGSYTGNLVISTPVRLVETLPGPYSSRLRGPGNGRRVVWITPEAGSLTEIRGFDIRGGRSQTCGAGIRADAPALIVENVVEGNQASGNGACGGGLYGVPGTRVIDDIIDYNSALGDPPPVDLWRPLPSYGGIGAGLYCLGCWVEGCWFNANRAASANDAVVQGEFRDNQVDVTESFYGPTRGAVTSIAARGGFLENTVTNSCGSFYPLVYLEGPGRVGWNTFSDDAFDMCESAKGVYLRGPMEFFHNTLAGLPLTICTNCRAGSPTCGGVDLRDNIVWAYTGGYATDYCESTGDERSVPIPITHRCNLMDALELQDADGYRHCEGCLDVFGDPRFCAGPVGWGEDIHWPYDLRLRSNSPALPEHSPAYCTEILGSQPRGCDIVPVVYALDRIEASGGGLRLEWTLSSDVAVQGILLEREAGADRVLLTPEPLLPCESCVYLDSDPPWNTPLRYWMTLQYADGEQEVYLLGEYDAATRLPEQLAIELRDPQPARGEIVVDLGVPSFQAWSRLELFDVRGRRVALLREGPLDPGWRAVRWAGRTGGGALQSGVYLMRLRAETGEVSRKLLYFR